MKLKTLPPKSKPQEGDYKIVNRFAWWPRRVENKLIWLESYKQVFEYKIHKRTGVHLEIGIIVKGVWGDWDLITEQLIK